MQPLIDSPARFALRAAVRICAAVTLLFVLLACARISPYHGEAISQCQRKLRAAMSLSQPADVKPAPAYFLEIRAAHVSFVVASDSSRRSLDCGAGAFGPPSAARATVTFLTVSSAQRRALERIPPGAELVVSDQHAEFHYSIPRTYGGQPNPLRVLFGEFNPRMLMVRRGDPLAVVLASDAESGVYVLVRARLVPNGPRGDSRQP